MMLDANKIYFEDCLVGMKRLPDESVDLVVTDPPYFINYKDWDKGINFLVDTENWLKEVFRVLKPTGTLWTFMGYSRVFDFVPLLNKYGICHLKNWVITAHSKGRGSSKHLKSIREDIFHATKTKRFVWNPLKTLREVVCPYVKDGRPRGWFIIDVPDGIEIIKRRVRWTGLGNVWVYSFPQYNSICEKQVHPCQKPIMMMERLIRLSSNEGDLVLDPFIGVGTTALACRLCNRNFIGFENNPDYYAKAIDKLTNFDLSKFTEYNRTIDKLLKATT